MKYALTNTNGRVLQVSKEEMEFIPEGYKSVELTDEQAIVGDSIAGLFIVDGAVVSSKVKQWMENPEAVKASLRPERNRLLSASDWTQLNDTTLPEDTLAAWAAYRQDLRDLTDGIDENGEVDFPEKP
jgi:hypothetical protein